MFLSEMMREPIKRQPILRWPGHLVGAAAIGLAVGMVVVPLDAAPRRFAPLPRSRPAMPGARPSAPPAAASPSQDQKQPSQTDDAAQEAEACLAHLRAASVEFSIPTMPVAARAACTIEVPVRLKSVTAQARAAAKVHLPEEPVVSCQFAERLEAWLGHLVAP